MRRKASGDGVVSHIGMELYGRGLDGGAPVAPMDIAFPADIGTDPPPISMASISEALTGTARRVAGGSHCASVGRSGRGSIEDLVDCLAAGLDRGSGPCQGLVVGQAPGPSTPLAGKSGGVGSPPPLVGLASARLCRLAGQSPKDMWRIFDRVNLLPEFPGPKVSSARGPSSSASSSSPSSSSSSSSFSSASSPSSSALLSTMSAPSSPSATLSTTATVSLDMMPASTLLRSSSSSPTGRRRRSSSSSADNRNGSSAGTSGTSGVQKHTSTGDAFPIDEARQAAEAINLSNYKLVILLGLNVARAFRIPAPKLFRRYYLHQRHHQCCRGEKEEKSHSGHVCDRSGGSGEPGADCDIGKMNGFNGIKNDNEEGDADRSVPFEAVTRTQSSFAAATATCRTRRFSKNTTNSSNSKKKKKKKKKEEEKEAGFPLVRFLPMAGPEEATIPIWGQGITGMGGMSNAADFTSTSRSPDSMYSITQEDTVVLVYPHPSGVSHFWNVEDNRRRARRELRGAMKQHLGIQAPVKRSHYFAGVASLSPRSHLYNPCPPTNNLSGMYPTSAYFAPFSPPESPVAHGRASRAGNFPGSHPLFQQQRRVRGRSIDGDIDAEPLRGMEDMTVEASIEACSGGESGIGGRVGPAVYTALSSHSVVQ